MENDLEKETQPEVEQPELSDGSKEKEPEVKPVKATGRKTTQLVTPSAPVSGGSHPTVMVIGKKNVMLSGAHEINIGKEKSIPLHVYEKHKNDHRVLFVKKES